MNFFYFRRSTSRHSTSVFLWFISCFLVNTFLLSCAYALPTEVSGINLIQGDKVEVKLRDSKKGTVVVFLSSKCPCSASHQGVLNELAQKFEPLGFRFIGVHSNANESPQEAQDYFKKSSFAFPVLQDEKSRIADQFEAFKTPHVFIVNPKGEILFQGGVDNSKLVERATRHYLKDALESLQNGKLPAEQNVRVVGCEIKRPNS